MCNGDVVILNPLFNFDPMKGLKHWGNVRMFGSTGNGTFKTIFNRLKVLNFSDG